MFDNIIRRQNYVYYRIKEPITIVHNHYGKEIKSMGTNFMCLYVFVSLKADLKK